MKLEYIVNENKYTTIKQILKEEFEMSDRLILKLKTNQKIFLNNEPTYVNKEVLLNDTITILINFVEDNSNIVATKMNLDIVYEDEAMLIINKPAGIAVHPSILHYDTSLSNGVKYYFDRIGLHKKIRPVNRLDKDTSGLVIFAKNEYVQEALVRQMKTHSFKKHYITIVNGYLTNKMSTINAPIARKENSIIERCVNKDGDIAITNYYVIKELSNNMSLVFVSLKTGRTHQIRVHMAHINHPIIGDSLYGEKSSIINRQALHACKVSFVHPITKVRMNFEAALPSDINNILSLY